MSADGWCKQCDEYRVDVDKMLESAGLVGEGCPWESVRQMADDLGEATFSYQVLRDGPDAHREMFDRAERVSAAAALLSSGSNP